MDESSTNIAMVPRYGRAPRGERAHGKAPRNWGKNVTLISSIMLSGMGPSMSIQGSSDTESFSLYMRKVLAPNLKSGQIVLMDNLSVHRGAWVRDLIEEKGCRLWLLPSYSPDMNPIEEAFSKVKNLIRKAKARTLEALFAATAEALERSARRTPVRSSKTAATAYFGDIHYENCSSSHVYCSHLPKEGRDPSAPPVS